MLSRRLLPSIGLRRSYFPQSTNSIRQLHGGRLQQRDRIDGSGVIEVERLDREFDEEVREGEGGVKGNEAGIAHTGVGAVFAAG